MVSHPKGRRGSELHVSDRSPVIVQDHRKPPACTNGPHHWTLDAMSWGTCDQCGEHWQFRSSQYLTFREDNAHTYTGVPKSTRIE